MPSPLLLGLTREQVVIVLAVAAVWLGFDFANPFLPLYVQELGVESVAEAALWSGLLISLAPAVSAVANPFWGAMADRFGAKPMMLRALAVFTVLLALMGLATSLWHLAVLRFGIGLLGGFAPLAVAMIVTSGPRARTAQALGVLQAAQFLPLALGPALGGVIADRVGLRVNFFLAASLCFAAVVLLVLLVRPRDQASGRAYDRPNVQEGESAAAREGDSPSHPPHPPSGTQNPTPDTRHPTPDTLHPQISPSPGPSPRRPLAIWSSSFLLPFGLLFIAYFVERSFLPILPLYVTVLGAPPDAVASSAGLVLAAGAVASAVSGPLLGRLALHYPLPRLAAAALSAGVVLCVLLSLVGSYAQLLGLRVALGLLSGGLPTLAYTMGAETAAHGTLGRQAGLLTSAVMLASATAPATAGLIATASLRSVFLVDAALLGLALVVFLTLGRRFEPRTSL